MYRSSCISIWVLCEICIITVSFRAVVCLSMWLRLLPCHWRPPSLSHFRCPILWPSCWSCHMPSMIWSLHHYAHLSFSLKCPPTPDTWIMYSLTLSGSLLKWYLLRGPSLTTTSKIIFPNLLPCFIFPHSIYNLIYMFINLFIYAPPSFALNSVKAGPGPGEPPASKGCPEFLGTQKKKVVKWMDN